MHAFTYYVKTFSFYSILQSIIESNLYKGRVQLFNENNKMFLCGEVVGKVRQKMNMSQDPRERREAQGKAICLGGRIHQKGRSRLAIADIVKQGFKIYH